MKNFVQPGNILDIEIPAGTPAGQGYSQGAGLFGVVVVSNDEAAPAVRSVVVEGVVEIAKLAADAMGVGAKVNWNDTNKEVQLAAGDMDAVGTVIEGAGASTTTVKIKLTPL